VAFNPYFRYETTSLDLADGVFAPSFPVSNGGKLHSYPTRKPRYTITNRFHGTTNLNWKSESVKPTDKATIYDFWNTTLNEGFNSFTVIDNRSRMLFDTEWDVWSQIWSKSRGGINNINYRLNAPVPWTPPVYGAYLMADDTLDNHTLQGSDISAVDGTLVVNGPDANVLRLNGSALRVDSVASTIQTGASGSVEWERSSKENSISLFCQIYITGTMSVGRVYFIEVAGGSNVYRLSIEAPNYIIGQLGDVSSTTVVRRASSPNFEADADTWYDVCFTYDAITEQNYLYFIESGDASFTDFLTEATTLDEQVGTFNGATRLDQANWSSVKLLTESVATAIPSPESMYVQNAMVFDGFMTTLEFNTMRRLCYMWNKKTTGTWPK
jgi:hypothetical protein